ncbi:hypothetical protein B0J11DRAFT_596984 [Dendryphion nanum]|uniref:Uncharacterized protein n=1 Tax=Dendryphion nanum TaxID=256645 RepID=A0A9P9ED77_9PLEO|nr:hypothetical protein B0J11DRAFT_596984 [Dendryphion nanum]
MSPGLLTYLSMAGSCAVHADSFTLRAVATATTTTTVSVYFLCKHNLTLKKRSRSRNKKRTPRSQGASRVLLNLSSHQDSDERHGDEKKISIKRRGPRPLGAIWRKAAVSALSASSTSSSSLVANAVADYTDYRQKTNASGWPIFLATCSSPSLSSVPVCKHPVPQLLGISSGRPVPYDDGCSSPLVPAYCILNTLSFAHPNEEHQPRHYTETTRPQARWQSASCACLCRASSDFLARVRQRIFVRIG